MQNDLTPLRERINTIDAELLRLLSERAQVALQVGKTKAAAGKELYDPERERRVLERLAEQNPGPLSAGAIDEVFSAIITVCRELEFERTDGNPSSETAS